MNVRVCSTSSAKNKVDKVLTSGTVLDCALKENTSIINPTFIVVQSSVGSLATQNYCYVGEWQRYYFINNIEVMTGGRIALHCSIDVLMSWRSQIKNIRTFISRNEYRNNKYFLDEQVPIRSERTVRYVKIGSLPRNTVNYLICDGGEIKPS